MKKTSHPEKSTVEAEEMPEHDFSKGVRGKYYARAIAGRVKVHLDPDVAELFPDDQAVNDALRALLKSDAENRRRPANRTPRASRPWSSPDAARRGLG